MKQDEMKKLLDKMVGQTYDRDNQEHYIEGYTFEVGHVKIHSDKRDFRIPLPQLDDNLRLFEPKGILPAHVKQSKDLNKTNSSVKGNDLKLMRDALTDTLERVRVDSGYIPQANAVSKVCGSIMQVAKTEIEMKKAALQGII